MLPSTSKIRLLIGTLLFVLIFSQFVSSASALTKSWDLTADFSGWTLTNTQATSDTIQLASSGGGTDAIALSATTLPTTHSRSSAVNDGNDNVYIFGGHDGTNQLDTVIKFVPSTGALTTMAATIPNEIDLTGSVWDPGNSRAYIFGGNGSVLGDEIYVFNPAANGGDGLVTQHSLFLPDLSTGPSAVWDDDNEKAYIFTGNDIFVFDPNANGGSGSSAEHALDLPAVVRYNPSVWDPVSNKVYIFGTWSGSGDEILVFDPNANSGAGSVSTHSVALPQWDYQMSAIWDTAHNKAYVFGGDNQAGNKTDIFVFDPSANSGAGNSELTSESLTTERVYSTAVWDEDQAKAYIFGGLTTANTLSTAQNSIDVFTPGGSLVYSLSGTARTVFTPSTGQVNDWETVTPDVTANSQTITFEYSNDASCTTGFTATLSSLTNSESICIRAAFSTSSSAVTPVLNALTLTYSIATDSASSSLTSTPSATPSSTACVPPSSAPAAPTNVAAADLGTGGVIVVTWENPQTCQVTTSVQIRDERCGAVIKTVSNITQQRLEVAGLENKTTYCFTLFSVGPLGSSTTTTGVTQIPTLSLLPKTGNSSR